MAFAPTSWCCHPTADGGWHERPECCIICGLPSASYLDESSSGVPSLLVSSALGTAWLDDWVGVTPEQPDKPIEIGQLTGPGQLQFELVCDSEGWESEDEEDADSCDEPVSYPFCTFRQAYPFVQHFTQTDKHHNIPELFMPPQQVIPGEEPAKPGYQPGLHWSDYSSQWVRYGVAFHRSCGKVLQQRLGYALSFDHTWPLLQEQLGRRAPMVNYFYYTSWPDGTSWQDAYGGVGGYYSEFDTFYMPMQPEDQYMLLDPLLCSSNADRIVRVWEPLVQRFREQGAAAAAAAAGMAAGSSDTAVDPLALPAQPAAAAAVVAEQTPLQADVEAAAAALAEGACLAAAASSQRPAGTALDPVLQSVLQLVVSRASSQLQPMLAAALLLTCSSMSQVLQDQLHVSVRLPTAKQAVSFTTWLCRYAGLVVGLQLEVAVDCCSKDIDMAAQAVVQAVSTAAHANKALRLTSLGVHLHSTAGATSLLAGLSLAHLTSLTLSGACEVTPEAAAALAAATALQSLTVPGKGLAASLAAASVSAERASTSSGDGDGGGSSGGGDTAASLAAQAASASPQASSDAAGSLSASLQRLGLTGAERCTAADFRWLGQQLKGLREVRLSYQPVLKPRDTDSAAWDEVILDERRQLDAPECWASLPVCSLEFGTNSFPGEHKLREGLSISHLLPTFNAAAAGSVSKLTGLTRLAFGANTVFEVGPDRHSGPPPTGQPMPQLADMLQPLTALQELDLTADLVYGSPYNGDVPGAWLIEASRGDDYHFPACSVSARMAVMDAIAQLPNLRRLHIEEGLCCGGDVGNCLAPLAAASKLQVLEIAGFVKPADRPSIIKLRRQLPGLHVICCYM